MPGPYASTKNAIGNCDRCGFEYPLRDLRKEKNNRVIQNLRVCPQCWDGDHPQNRLGQLDFSDNQALKDPRPDSGAIASRTNGDYIFDFVDGIDSWTSNVGTTAHDAVNDHLVYEWVDQSDPQLRNLTISPLVDTAIYSAVVVRFETITRSNIASVWAGDCFFIRDTDVTISLDRHIALPEPVYSMGDQFVELTWDFSNNEYWTGNIEGIRLDFYGAPGSPQPDSTGRINVDWIRFTKRVGV